MTEFPHAGNAPDRTDDTSDGTVEVSTGAAHQTEGLGASIMPPKASVEIIPPFDYRALEPAIADKLRQVATRVRRRNSDFIIETGRDLLQAKDDLDHGQWGVWLRTECQLKERTAQRMMNVAAWAEGKSDTVTDLPPGILYRLSARSTPPELVDAVLSRVGNGERVSPTAVKEMLRIAKGPSSEPKEPKKDQPAATVTLDTMKRDICLLSADECNSLVYILLPKLSAVDRAALGEFLEHETAPPAVDPTTPNHLELDPADKPRGPGHIAATAMGIDDVEPAAGSIEEPPPVAPPEPPPELSADDKEQTPMSDPGPTQPGGDKQLIPEQSEETGPATTALPGASAAVPEALHGGRGAHLPEQHSRAAGLSNSNDDIHIDNWCGRKPPPEVTCNAKGGECRYLACSASGRCGATAPHQVAA